jgi:ribosome-binding factor A
MEDHRDERLRQALLQEASKFVSLESNRRSLVTPTRIEMSKDAKYVTIFVSVFPESMETAAIDFLKRKRSEFKHHIKKNTRVARIPFVDFELDEGEKARQRIEEISQELKKEQSDS